MIESKMVGATEVSWQNKTIPARSDMGGVLALGLLAAWFYFLWQFLSLPPLAGVAARLPPLAGFALDKARYMPDFGMIIAGCLAFHFRRGLWREWDRHVARQTYVAAVLPLLAYLVLGILLLEAVHLVGPGHAAVPPWEDPLMRVQVLVILPLIVCAVIWPMLLHLMWTCDSFIPAAGAFLGLMCFGMGFQIGTHRILWMWPPTALIDFAFGVCLCASLLRALPFIAAVRGPTIILGWLVMLGASIQDGPGLFFIGFLMILSGVLLRERSWQLPGEAILRLWSRTALAIVIAQPSVFAAWLAWGGVAGDAPVADFVGLALVTQVLAVLLICVVEAPARRLLPAVSA